MNQNKINLQKGEERSFNAQTNFPASKAKRLHFLLVQIQIDFHLPIKYQYIRTKIIEKHEMVNNSSNKMIK